MFVAGATGSVACWENAMSQIRVAATQHLLTLRTYTAAESSNRRIGKSCSEKQCRNQLGTVAHGDLAKQIDQMRFDRRQPDTQLACDCLIAQTGT